MADVNIVQAQGFAGYSGSFTDNVTEGNSVILLVIGANNGGTMSSSSPTYNGSEPAGATMLAEVLENTGSATVYVAAWLLPNLTGGAQNLSIMVSNNFYGSPATGFAAFEISGLGANPTLDAYNTDSNANSGTVSSGASGAISHAPELIVAALGTFGNAMSEVGSPWTEVQFGDNFLLAAAQVADISGGSYTYSQTATSGAWAGLIVTLYVPPSSGSGSGLLMAGFP